MPWVIGDIKIARKDWEVTNPDDAVDGVNEWRLSQLLYDGAGSCVQTKDTPTEKKKRQKTPQLKKRKDGYRNFISWLV